MVEDRRYDAVIVGAAAVGLACALALRAAGLRVALCDRTPLKLSPPSDAWDARIYAISPGSAAFLHAVRVWQRMPEERMQAIESMRVFGDDGAAAINFSAYDVGERALAWIVENRALHDALMHATLCMAGRDEDLQIFAPVQAHALAYDAEGIRLDLADGRSLHAALVIGADGAHSWVRSAA